MGKRVLACFLLLLQAQAQALGGAAFLENPADPFYNAKANPLPSAVTHLLMENHYFVHSDGSIWSPFSKEEIRKSQMRVLIRRLKSTERLKALLKIDLILSEDGSRHLTPDDLKKMRHILRLAWPYFTLDNRKHFARYFSLEELYSLNATPPDEEADPDLLAEEPLGTPPPLPALPESSSPAASVPEVSGNSQGIAENSVAVMPTLSPSSSLFSPTPAPQVTLPASPSLPASSIAPANVVSPVVPVVPPHSVLAPTPSPLPQTVAVTPISPSVSVASTAVIHSPSAPALILSSASAISLGTQTHAPSAVVHSTTPITSLGLSPEVLKQALAASSVVRPRGSALAETTKEEAKPASLPPLETTSLQALEIVSSADFEKFLLEAPYSGDAKGLLRLISSYAQEPFRSRALETIMTIVPAIISDSDRTGLHAHEAVFLKEKKGENPEWEIALNPGPVLSLRREFLFEKLEAMIPSSAKAYKELQLPVPSVQALNPSAEPEKTKAGSWGQKTEIYSDDSLHGNFSTFESAGFLLRALLELRAKVEGWSAFPYQEESYAYSGQMLLYAQIKDGAKSAKFLDPQMRALFEDWLNHPARFHDFLIHSLSSGRSSLWDLRHIEASRRDFFIRKSYISCPQSLKQAESLRSASKLEVLKKDALSLARARLDADADFKKALRALDSAAAVADSKETSPTERACAAYWQKEFSGSMMLDGLLKEAADAESQFRKKTGAIYAP